MLRVFETFDIAARAVVTQAHREARNHGSDYIGTEHLLLGALGDGAVGDTLRSFAVTFDEIRSRVEDSIGPAGTPQPGYLPFSRRAKLALKRTRAMSEASGLDFVRSTHVLAALMSDGQSAAAQAILSLGVQPSALRERVLNHGAGRPGTDH